MLHAYLILPARRAEALALSRVQPDVVIGSRLDLREASRLEDYRVPPKALIMTEGADGGTIETASGSVRFSAPASPSPQKGAYGAGDSFAGALTCYLACGLGLDDACAHAAQYGAAVLRGTNPLDNQLELEMPDS